MRIVVVDKFVPYPANDGGKLRSAAILSRLAGLGEVVLCTFETEPVQRDYFEEAGVDVRTVPWTPTAQRTVRGLLHTGSASAGRFWDGRLAALVRDTMTERPTDVLLVEHGQLGPYLSIGQAGLRVLDLHNIDSSLAASYARSARSPAAELARIEAALLRRLEARVLARADVVVTVSADDVERIPPQTAEMLLCPNGWEPQPILPPAPDPVVVFVAALGWTPNADAALWFGHEVWPRVLARCPSARLLLVGKDPTSAVRELAGDTIEVTGTVPDVRSYLARARIAVAPLLAGGGTRLKVLEALDAGRPVVGTAIGLEGLPQLIDNGAEVVDGVEAMAEAICRLLADPARAVALGARGHEAVARHYAWDTVLSPMLDRLSGAKA